MIVLKDLEKHGTKCIKCRLVIEFSVSTHVKEENLI